jgi:hypothetical protein
LKRERITAVVRTKEFRRVTVLTDAAELRVAEWRGDWKAMCGRKAAQKLAK